MQCEAAFPLFPFTSFQYGYTANIVSLYNSAGLFDPILAATFLTSQGVLTPTLLAYENVFLPDGGNITVNLPDPTGSDGAIFVFANADTTGVHSVTLVGPSSNKIRNAQGTLVSSLVLPLGFGTYYFGCSSGIYQIAAYNGAYINGIPTLSGNQTWSGINTYTGTVNLASATVTGLNVTEITNAVSKVSNPIQIGSTAATSQGTNSIALGELAGTTGQNANSIAIGPTAGQTNQGISSVAIGNSAGSTTQGYHSVAVGLSAGQTTQGINCTAIGYQAGFQNQTDNGTAVGVNAGAYSQGSKAVALGSQAGQNNQGNNAISIGNQAGYSNQANNSICLNATGAAINPTVAGFIAAPVRSTAGTTPILMSYDTTNKELIASGASVGQITGAAPLASPALTGNPTAPTQTALNNSTRLATTAYTDAAVGVETTRATTAEGLLAPKANPALTGNINYSPVNIGTTAATSQGAGSIGIGNGAGVSSQGASSVAIGINAGNSSQAANNIAIGYTAGQTSQGTQSIAIGSNAGQASQGSNCSAIGYGAGTTNQGANATAIGWNAGNYHQGSLSVAIGSNCGTNSGAGSVQIGDQAGNNGAGTSSVALGQYALVGGSSAGAIGIGYFASGSGASTNSIAIGYNCAFNTIGANAVAIGAQTGATAIHANAICLNASGTGQNATVAGFIVNPVRSVAGSTPVGLSYDTTNNEIIATGLQYTVATLPTPSSGMRCFVTDALTPTFGTTVVGGGAVFMPVFYNGTNWTVG